MLIMTKTKEHKKNYMEVGMGRYEHFDYPGQNN